MVRVGFSSGMVEVRMVEQPSLMSSTGTKRMFFLFSFSFYFLMTEAFLFCLFIFLLFV